MADAEDIDEALAESVMQPKRVQVGNQSVDQQSVDDFIKASNHLAAKQAAANGGLGIRLFQIVPPGGG